MARTKRESREYNEMPDSLKCYCEYPFIIDDRISGLGFYCVMCGCYADEIVEKILIERYRRCLQRKQASK